MMLSSCELDLGPGSRACDIARCAAVCWSFLQVAAVDRLEAGLYGIGPQ